MKSFTEKTIARASFSNCKYFFSASKSVLDVRGWFSVHNKCLRVWRRAVFHNRVHCRACLTLTFPWWLGMLQGFNGVQFRSSATTDVCNMAFLATCSAIYKTKRQTFNWWFPPHLWHVQANLPAPAHVAWLEWSCISPEYFSKQFP